jgi:hypothetical protein
MNEKDVNDPCEKRQDGEEPERGWTEALEWIRVRWCCDWRRVEAAATRHLVQAALSRAGSPHLVYISVVGADRIPVESSVDRRQLLEWTARPVPPLAARRTGRLDVGHRRPVR